MLKNLLITLFACITAGLALQVQAGGSILPDIPEAQARFSEAQGCVRPTEDMRRNHMKYLLHKRDLTMHDGIRTTQISLKGCIDCHVSSSPDAPRFPSEKHFCNSCHTYAAVDIDCFQCHADRPLRDAQGHFVVSGNEMQQQSGAGKLHVLATEGDAHE